MRGVHPLAGEGGAKRRRKGLDPQARTAVCGDRPLTRIASFDAIRPLPQGER
jgi:hypothetical protein